MTGGLEERQGSWSASKRMSDEDRGVEEFREVDGIMSNGAL